MWYTYYGSIAIFTRARVQGMRAPQKQNTIVSELRSRIISGELELGERLPPRADLERQFGVCSETMQVVMDRLARDGFVRSEHRRGTFVSGHPPHLCRYGVVLPEHPDHAKEHFSNFWASIISRARAIDNAGSIELPMFYGIDFYRHTPETRQLASDLRARRLAGIIYASHPWPVEGTPLMKHPVPRVAIMPEQVYPDVPVANLDVVAFLDRALEHLASLGRRRVAVIYFPGLRWTDHMSVAIARHGMRTRPYWLQPIDAWSSGSASSCANLLMHCAEKPDALIIADDNLVPGVSEGLLASGARVPDDLEVVAHTNFPCPTRCAVPATRLGFDIDRLLRTCIDLVGKQRLGRKVPGVTRLTPVFEHEYAEGALSLSAGAPEHG